MEGSYQEMIKVIRKPRGIIPNVSVFEEGKDLGVIPKKRRGEAK